MTETDVLRLRANEAFIIVDLGMYRADELAHIDDEDFMELFWAVVLDGEENALSPFLRTNLPLRLRRDRIDQGGVVRRSGDEEVR